MYIIIAGGGIVGRNITKSLSKSHDIVVIDSKNPLVSKFTPDMGLSAFMETPRILAW